MEIKIYKKKESLLLKWKEENLSMTNRIYGRKDDNLYIFMAYLCCIRHSWAGINGNISCWFEI
jgi:hypothetical protein